MIPEQRDIANRLQNLYLRGYRAAVNGGCVHFTQPNSAYVAGYSAGERALKQAASSAKEYAEATVNGERVKP